MKVNEIFFSLQGEGILSGMPTVFIRTTGCNLRCVYCDTKYAYYDGVEISVEEVVRRVKRHRCRYICITGGEPLLQNSIYNLINELKILYYNILIETNGSEDIVKLKSIPNVMVSLDIKCPSSGMHKQMLMNNISTLHETDQLKFIIQSKEDYTYGVGILQKYRPVCTVFFQPVWGLDPKRVAKWILADGIEARLGLQLHKIIWGENTVK